MPRLASSFPAVLAAFLLAGCVPPPAPSQGFAAPLRPPAPVVVSYPPIPAERVEVIPPPPRREFVRWQPGHWRWDGYRYDWIAGHYVERVAGATRWVPGHWDARPGGYAWVAGRWV